MALINCPDCGHQVSDAAPVCPHCGRGNPGAAAGGGDGYEYATPGGQPHAPPAAGQSPVPNYLVQSILVTLCCCLPAGIVSIVFAVQANSRRDAGDIPGALDSAAKAKLWAWVGFGVGIVFYIGYAALFGFGILAELGNLDL